MPCGKNFPDGLLAEYTGEKGKAETGTVRTGRWRRGLLWVRFLVFRRIDAQETSRKRRQIGEQNV